MSTKKTGRFAITLEELKSFGLSAEGGSKVYFGLNIDGHKYTVFLSYYDDETPNSIDVAEVDLSGDLKSGFPKEGFSDGQRCNDYWLQFVLMNEVARNIAGTRKKLVGAFKKNGRSYNGGDMADYRPKFAMKIRSRKDLQELIGAVTEFDSVINGENFREALGNLQATFADDLDEHINWAFKCQAQTE